VLDAPPQALRPTRLEWGLAWNTARLAASAIGERAWQSDGFAVRKGVPALRVGD
jgi:hypothetical protein